MFWLRLTLGGLLVLAGSIGVLSNFWIMIREIRGQHAPSTIPLFAGLLAAIGVAILPFHGAVLLAAVPVLLDWGGCLQLIRPFIIRSNLPSKVRRIDAAIKRLASSAAQEPVRVTHYGAFDIHPRHLVYWVCVKTDAERNRLRADQVLVATLRQTLIDYDYPLEGRDHVQIGFESQETVDRDSGGTWWGHWR